MSSQKYPITRAKGVNRWNE